MDFQNTKSVISTIPFIYKKHSDTPIAVFALKVIDLLMQV